MLTYKQVEAALAKIHHVDDGSIGAFRGRIKHFQKIGLVTSSPGKGKRISYGVYDLLYWAYCLELTQFGIDPTLIKNSIINIMTFFIDAFELVDKTEKDVYLVFHPNILSSYMQKDKDMVVSAGSTLGAIYVLEDKGASFGAMKERLTPKVRFEKTAPTALDLFDRRTALINMTQLKRQLELALSTIPGVPKGLLRDIVFERIPPNPHT